MKYTMWLAFLLSGVAVAAPGDGFQREDGNRGYKDALEGKAPPSLDVEGWMNSGGKPLDWDALRGKVVVLDFWGTW